MLPSYLEKLSVPELYERVEELERLLIECSVCPRCCGAKRLEGKIGTCKSTDEIVISGAHAHFGEEPPLVGLFGSGTIFFSHCNLCCQYCQNYDISHLGYGEKVSVDELAVQMLLLQNKGCHNINLVSPTHYTPQIVKALVIAIEKGLEIPILYNCGGYESVETLKLLEDIVDIYMPDIKYSDNKIAMKYSGAKDYWDVVRKSAKEMHRQVGDLRMSRRGIAQRGLLIRHLVLPNNLSGSKKILDFIKEEISPGSYVNIMDQYHPAYRADRYPELNRRITKADYDEVIVYANNLGLRIAD